jgi:hypothetical protein
MSKKGRRGRSKKGKARPASGAPLSIDGEVAARPSYSPTVTSDKAPAAPAAATQTAPATPAAPPETAPAAPASSADEADPPAVVTAVPPPETLAAPAEQVEPRSPAGAMPPQPEPAPAAVEGSIPPAGDLDARFFAESSSEAWLARELEHRDPQLLRKMTANVVRRRAHLARYVVGVVGVAIVLCLAALIKSAVPAADDAPPPRPAAQLPVPAAQPAPLPLPIAAPAPPAASVDRTDGGG